MSEGKINVCRFAEVLIQQESGSANHKRSGSAVANYHICRGSTNQTNLINLLIEELFCGHPATFANICKNKANQQSVPVAEFIDP